MKAKQLTEIVALNGDAVQDAGSEDLSSEELEKLTLQVDGEETPQAESKPAVKLSDTTEETTANGTASQGKKRNRQKDRLARRAAENEEAARQAEQEAQNLPDLKTQERERMLASMKLHGLVEKEIRADGHCLYSAIADQLQQLDVALGDSATTDEKPRAGYLIVRARAADYIEAHQDDFVPFLEEPLPEYLLKVRSTGEWGGQLELMALAKTYSVDINVLQDFGRVEKIEGETAAGEEKKSMWLGYYKYGFGLGEHYNSLRKAS